MRIESIIARKPGSTISLFGTEYVFTTRSDGKLCADVEDEKHIERFLSIPEGYRDADGELVAKPTITPARTTVDPVPTYTIPMGYPTQFTMPNGANITIEYAVERAALASGLSFENWEALDEEARSEQVDAMLDIIERENQPAQPDERALAAADYEAKLGRKPHYKWNAAKIREELAKAEAQ
jgi:hypothetical protein